MLELLETRLGDHHSGEPKRESAEAKAGRIIREESERLGWGSKALAQRLKSDPVKLSIAMRPRGETTVTVALIAYCFVLRTPVRAALGAGDLLPLRTHPAEPDEDSKP